MKKKNIKKEIYNVYSNISSNKTLILHLISKVEENRAMILNNYNSAFSVNTKLTTENTDEIFNNRELILSKYYTKTNNIEKKFNDSEKESLSIDYIKHKVNAHSEILNIVNEMSEVNSKLINLNKKIMKFNQNVVNFNSKQISINKDLLKEQKKIKITKNILEKKK
ncbi:MAG: hypothetical protein ACJ0GH_01800 [Alphaproteobacteria bacterium]